VEPATTVCRSCSERTAGKWVGRDTKHSRPVLGGGFTVMWDMCTILAFPREANKRVRECASTGVNTIRKFMWPRTLRAVTQTMRSILLCQMPLFFSRKMPVIVQMSVHFLRENTCQTSVCHNCLSHQFYGCVLRSLSSSDGFLEYVTKFLQHHTLRCFEWYRQDDCEWWSVKDVERNDRGLFLGIIPEFVWRGEEELLNTSVSFVS
jgi:hypothetical protein